MNKSFVKFLLLCCVFSQIAFAQDAKELAQQAVNPLTTNITVPIQFEYNDNIGPEDEGTRSTLFFQPVIPFELNEDWNLITRTILPIIEQDDIFPNAGSQSGIGDVSESLFFSPVERIHGWIVGAGPYVQFDTATDDYLGMDEHGAGASLIALTVEGHWLYGFLANQVYSVEESIGKNYSFLFIQPFVDYTTDGGLTWEFTSESTYNWKDSEWSIPLTLTASQFFMIGDQPILLGGGFKYWAQSTETDPEGLSLNFNIYLLFPK